MKVKTNTDTIVKFTWRKISLHCGTRGSWRDGVGRMIWPSTVVEVLAATAPLVSSDSSIASVNGAHPHPSFSADDFELLDAVRWRRSWSGRHACDLQIMHEEKQQTC